MIAEKIARSLPPSFDVADLKQEALLGLWKALARYDPVKNDNVRGYAYLAVRGAVLMKCRRKYYTAEMGEELPEDELSLNPAPDVQLDAQRARIREERRLRRQRRDVELRMAKLPQSANLEEFVLRRVFLEGNDVEFVAEALGCSTARVRRALAAGIRMLKRGY